MGKTMKDDNDDPDDDPPKGKRRRDKGKKRYWASRGLIKPKVIPIKSEIPLRSSLLAYKVG